MVGRTDWSVTDYVEELRQSGPRCSGQNEKSEETLRTSFPSGDPGFIIEPSIDLDKDGMILLWYLPGLVMLEYRLVDNMM